jgi:cobalamin-dependent methionine synthase I
VEIVERLIADVTGNRGVDESSIRTDCLTFTIYTGHEELRKDGIETIEVIRLLKQRHPDVQTTLGLSNISFGLNPAARRIGRDGRTSPAALLAGPVVNRLHPRACGRGVRLLPAVSQGDDVIVLTEPGRIGVTLSEELQLHPEQSTDAFVLHHPEAMYFNT